MALTKCTTIVNNIQSLADKPTSADGLTTATFKAKFDQTGSDLKDYINNTLTDELDTELAAKYDSGDVGTSSETICAGDDSRLSDSRQCNNSFDDASTSRTNLGLGDIVTRNITISTSDASGGSDGDIWIKYSA